MFVFVIHVWNFGKFSIVLASSGSFNMKVFFFYLFFFCLFVFVFCCFGCKCWICRPRSKTKIHRLERASKSWLRKNQSENGNLPYNNMIYSQGWTLVCSKPFSTLRTMQLKRRVLMGLTVNWQLAKKIVFNWYLAQKLVVKW